jgi:hypothetical protein
LIGLARMLPAGQAAMQLGIFDPIACAATRHRPWRMPPDAVSGAHRNPITIASPPRLRP